MSAADARQREREAIRQAELDRRRRHDDAAKHGEQRAVEAGCPVCGLYPHQSWCPRREP